MSDMNISQVLSQIRAMSTAAQGGAAAAIGDERQDFSALLKTSVDKVNELQKTSAGLATAFELGDKNVELAQVMIASEKAGLSFQALTQVRNKLLSAYQDIMNMPV